MNHFLLYIRTLFGIGASVLLCLCGYACGSSSGVTVKSASHQLTSGGSSSTYKNDRDNDGDHNDDDFHVLDFGHVPGPAEREAITALVTNYYAAAAAGEGAKGCSLLVPFIAESVAESIGHSPKLRGKTCPVVMSKLFKYNHSELANKSASLKVMRVGVEGDKSLVALEFPTIPEVRQITVRRTGGTWRVLSVLDVILE